MRPLPPRAGSLRNRLRALSFLSNQGDAHMAMNLTIRTMAILAACTMALPAAAKEKVEKGIASWYGYAEEGRLTASGQTMDHQRLTAAHRSLPFGSVVEVVNQRNGRSVQVTIN